jgi:uncharacterized repeat protein (TIGR03847 family)
MPRIELDVKPVIKITTDAIGKPGERVFFLQGSQQDQVVTLIVEKIQIQSLAIGVDQFLEEVNEKNPGLPPASDEYVEADMQIQAPVDPLFRVGEIGLGYDVENDLVVLVAREVVVEGENAEEASVVRFWCSRSQMRAMSRWGAEVVARGRPICPLCGEPMDPEGHFCPKKNGHNKH